MPETMEIDYAKLAQSMMQQMMGVTYKAVPSSTPTGTYGHGNGGLFSAPGLSRQVFSAMVLPNLGLQSILPVRGARETNPLYGIMTGVTATSGAEPVGVCDDPPTSGLMKLCEHSFVFGRQSRSTRVFDLDRIGQLTNRGEFSDLQFLGGPFADGSMPNAPTIPGADPSAALNNEVNKAMFELAVAWGRDFARELYTGNPVNNTAGGGRKYFYGLDLLINTGYRDAETSVACPAADSIVRSFGGANINSNGAQIVQEITYTYRNLRYIAQRTGLDPVTWAVCMPWSLFYELTAIWPCAYLTARCAVPAGSTQFVDAGDQITMRDQMRGDITSRTGQYLMIDGQRVEVVLDDAITETEGFAGGTFQSTIYFVPLRVLGNTPSTFIEYYNYDTPGGSMDASRVLAPNDSYYTSDGGRFFWHKKPPTNFCVQVIAKTEPRVLLLTPYLAARITGIRYTPLLHERSPFSDSGYFVNGGKTDRGGYGPSYYSPTA
jgi:hypothetical protein